MVAVLLPVFDPTPSSVAEIASRLPAHERARIEWFPQALRTAFIEPLARASGAEFDARVDELTVDAVRTLLRLVASLGALTPLLDPDAITRAIDQEASRRATHDLIRQRLEAVDEIAADDLHEAYEWLRAILTATAITLGPELQANAAEAASLVRQGHTISDTDLRRELVGEARSFVRGLLLTIGALDVLERDPLPSTTVAWCALALMELHATANAFRASGQPIPTEVVIPGYAPAQWREHRRAQTAHRAPSLVGFLSRGSACPPGILEQIVKVTRPEEIWLFGSRARGTAGPESDWDLLVVVPDAASTPFDNETWNALREVRRQQVELVAIRKSDFEAERHEFGSLAHIVATSGRRIYER